MINSLDHLNTPIFICELDALEKNLQTFQALKNATGVEVLLSLKGFALHAAMPLISKYLDGCAASSLYEAKFAKESVGKKIHTYAPAFRPDDVKEIIATSDRITFNSLSQFDRHKTTECSCGIRVNTQSHLNQPAYCNPNLPDSRMGVQTLDRLPDGIEGLHLHALCAQTSFALEQVLSDFKERFGHLLPKVRWINLGGGHALTHHDYSLTHLIELLQSFLRTYPHLQLIMEPAHAVVHDCGILVASVLDIIENEIPIAILDTCTEAHLIDTIITKVPPRVRGAEAPGIKPYNVRLAGNSCLAGDVFGDYSLDEPLQVGDKVIFEDRMHYSFIKANTFNGIALPDLAIAFDDGRVEVVRRGTFQDYKSRL